MPTTHVIQEFDRHLPGRVLTRSNPEFDQRRRIYNGMIDRKPALIVKRFMSLPSACGLKTEQQPHSHLA